jgi:hypothetical protein
MQKFSITEVQKHNLSTDCWIVIDNNVYDISKYVPLHPGGVLILSCAGADATVMFHQYHAQSLINSKLMQQLKKYHIGRVTNHTSPVLGDAFKVLYSRVEDELKSSPRHPFFGVVMFFSDILFYLVMSYLVFYIWWAGVTNVVAIAVTLYFVDVASSRVAGQGHALGHMQIFGRSYVEKADKLMIILSKSYLVYALPSMDLPFRHKLSQRRVISQKEYPIGRGRGISMLASIQ